MSKQYQTSAAEASTLGLTIPAEVSVALAEIAHSATEGLLALTVGAGLQVLGTLVEESVTALAGPKGKHNPDRTAVRHGHEQGLVTFGGRRVGVQRPRVRAADGSGELPVAASELFSSTALLGRLALQRILGGRSTRRYGLAWSRSGPGSSRARRAPPSRRSPAGSCHDPDRPGRAAHARPVHPRPGVPHGRGGPHQ
jgi:hypothetical protein